MPPIAQPVQILRNTTKMYLAEAVIGFSQSVYEVSEDENAVVDIQVTNGRIDVPVTVR